MALNEIEISNLLACTETRKTGKQWMVQQVSTIDYPYWKSEQEVLDAVRAATKDMTDWVIELEHETGYYDESERDVLRATAWRKATAEESRLLQEKRDRMEAQQKINEEKTIEHLKKTRPELFK